jgi:hypothetical protein
MAPTNIVQGQPGAPREWLVTVRRNFQNRFTTAGLLGPVY